MFSSDAFKLLGGDSPALQAVLRSAALVAATDATALVTGESGTGKELLARGMHEASRRHAGPWVPVNCAALPSELVEAELFGYWKGAFTGADRNAPGFVHQAQNGTLFLDEIAELTLAGQAKLLRFLEEGECQRLGSGRAETLDVRVIAATHQDLSALVAQGRFRSDLFYRLNVIPLTLPPLRERDGDVGLLLDRFRRELAQTHGVDTPAFAQSARTRLTRYAWPGNVRELRNLVERCVVLMPGRTLESRDLPVEWFADSCVSEPHLGVYLPPEGVRLEDVEADLIRQALSRSGGNRTRAAALVGVTRDTLLYRLKKHGLITGSG
jgi:DNA-binding NtrC family response regulator